jgi:hypothetical protein
MAIFPFREESMSFCKKCRELSFVKDALQYISPAIEAGLSVELLIPG